MTAMVHLMVRASAAVLNLPLFARRPRRSSSGDVTTDISLRTTGNEAELFPFLNLYPFQGAYFLAFGRSRLPDQLNANINIDIVYMLQFKERFPHSPILHYACRIN